MSAGGPQPGWLVRNESGETFGPVDLETLVSWAADGRLAPTNEVSEGGAVWVSVTSLRVLGMDWVAEVSPANFYGPIHRRALDDLLKDGSIPAQGALFVRRGAEGSEPAKPDAALVEQAQRLEGELLDARAEAGAARELLQQAQAEAADCLAREREAALLAAERAGLLEKQRLAADESERRLRQALAEQEQQARRNLSTCEEQVRLAQQQVAAYAGQVAQAREACAAAESRADAAAKRALEQAEQARAASELSAARAAAFERTLDALRAEHAKALSAAAEIKAERAALSAAAEARERAFEAERQELRAAVGQAQAEKAQREEKLSQLEKALGYAQAERALREERLAQLERALAGAEGAGADRGALESRALSLSAELEGLKLALAGERDAARQAEARCAALDRALDEMKALRDAGDFSAGELCAEIREVKRLVQALDARVAEAALRGEARSERAEVERVYVEVEPVDVLPPETPKAQAKAAEPARAAQPERPPIAAEKAEQTAGRPTSGLSLAELEQQARRELERLGAHGANLFKKRK